MSEENSAEIVLFEQFKKLASDMIESACNQNFSIDQVKEIYNRLIALLTAPEGITNFEFQKSGLLNAIVILLTKSPSQA